MSTNRRMDKKLVVYHIKVHYTTKRNELLIHSVSWTLQTKESGYKKLYAI